jgi:UDP:flavonoid glycosyltransferase YjiC (YdhE family)
MEYAFFISPHGFGHASRSLAVMEALRDLDRKAYFHIFTTVPEWFFSPSLAGNFSWHPLGCDVGFAQTDPFSIDFKATQESLAGLLPFRSDLIEAVARQLAGCCLVVSDIAPLGIDAAAKAGIPSVLLENFTWDHIYEYFLPDHPFLGKWRSLLGQIYSRADYCIQTEPLCLRKDDADLLVGPVSRRPKLSGARVREALSIGAYSKIVLVSLGGFPCLIPDFEAASAKYPDSIFVVPSDKKRAVRRGNLMFLPQWSELPHADIVHQANALVCKAGYSTLAEGYCAGVPTVAILRDHYPETSTLASFVERILGGTCLMPGSLKDGSWIALIPKLLEQDRQPGRPSAAGEVARFLLALV